MNSTAELAFLIIVVLKNMALATNGNLNLLRAGLGAGAAALGIGGMIFRMGRQIITKKDLDETKKELKVEIDKIRNDYKNIATKEDIEKLFNKLKPPN